jgi:Icc protein
VAFVVSGGDLIMDALKACEPEAREQYRLYEELTTELNVPLFNAPGNHELYGIYLEGVGEDFCIVEESDPLYGVGMYREYLGPDYYSFNWGPYHFMVLNTMGLIRVRTEKGDTVRTYYGTVSTDQIAWMKKDLTTVPLEAPIILVSHIPFMTAVHTFEGYGEYQSINYRLEDPEAKSYTHVVSNAAEVINQVLAGRNLILALAGHHHHHEEVRWQTNEHDALFVLGGSVAGQWWQGDRRIAGSSWPEGYVSVRLEGGELNDLEYISFDWKGYKE